MQRIKNLSQSIAESGGSAVDGNRLYSILLDARASKASESMFDVAENILINEKDNSRLALERLWALRKDMLQSSETGTVDLLIKYYQEKLDILREKEETIRRVSCDSRTLLEEKRKRDGELAGVKQETADCTGEIERLNAKLHKLTVKEQELSLIEMQVSKELQANANEIVNGLYEIILSQQSLGHKDPEQGSSQPSNDSAKEEIRPDNSSSGTVASHEPAEKMSETALTEPVTRTDVLADLKSSGDDTEKITGITLLRHVEPPAKPPFPKSVVKTTRGAVIAEYYFDPGVYKNKRHYIYNSDFLRDQLSVILNGLKKTFTQERFAEAVQIIQDAQKRIDGNANLHFEVSTNEILNSRSLRDALVSMKTRRFDEVLELCGRLGAKITALGGNYTEMLKEQMSRLVE